MSPGEAHDQDGVLRLVHHHPGRLRLRSPAFEHEGGPATRAREALLATGVVHQVTHHALTGSLLVAYQPGPIAPDILAAAAAQAAGLRLRTCVAARPARPHGAWLIDTCRELNAATHQLSGARVELRVLVPATLAAFSVVTLFSGKGGRLPRWDSLAYWSITFFAMLHGREMGGPAAAPAEPGSEAPR